MRYYYDSQWSEVIMAPKKYIVKNEKRGSKNAYFVYYRNVKMFVLGFADFIKEINYEEFVTYSLDDSIYIRNIEDL